MNREPPLSPASLRAKESLADQSESDALDHLRGLNDLKERIAIALSARTEMVEIDHWGYGPSRLSARCSGSWNGRRFFGKTLLADPFPVPPRFSPPWEEPSSGSTRAAQKQIEAEWEMTLKMRAYSDASSLPVPLGRSTAARTIVWEEAVGIRLDKALKSRGWFGEANSSGTDAMFQAGKWLRSLQTASNQGSEVLNVGALISASISRMQHGEGPASNYARIATKVLESCQAGIGGVTELHVPVTFAHGDFCLPNLLWNDSGRQLTVIDFELSGFRTACQDLFAIVCDLRAHLLNPLIPKRMILAWEESFWQGYGPIPAQLRSFIDVLALARVFYHNLGRLLTRSQRKGPVAGLSAQLYRTFLERAIITHRLDLPREYVTL